MDEKTRQEIALARYDLISPVIARSRDRKLARGELTAMLKEIASQPHVLPFTSRTSVAFRTLETYFYAYRKGGLDALKPAKESRRVRKIPSDLESRIIALKRENSSRSVPTIIAMLEESSEAERGFLRESTLYDLLARAGLTRAHSPKKESFRRFQAQERNELWQGDAQHSLYLPVDGKNRKTYLIAWLDDYSRLVTHAQFYFEERLPRLEDSLKKAVAKHGLPRHLYVDNGSMYSSEHLRRICARLGIHLTHSTPSRPQGRGKLERLFSFVETSFTSEARLLVEKGELSSLEELNELFRIWCERCYHEKVHSSTKQKPIIRFNANPAPLRYVPLEELEEAFLWEETRTTDATGVFSLDSNKYETVPELARCKITVAFDPFDLREIRVFLDGKRYPDAVPLKVERHSHTKVSAPEPEPSQETGLNYLSILQARTNEQGAPTSFTRLKGGNK